MADLKAHIQKVAGGASLTEDEAADAFGSIMSGEATPSQIGGFLMALRVRGETVEEITGPRASCGPRSPVYPPRPTPCPPPLKRFFLRRPSIGA